MFADYQALHNSRVYYKRLIRLFMEPIGSFLAYQNSNFESEKISFFKLNSTFFPFRTFYYFLRGVIISIVSQSKSNSKFNLKEIQPRFGLKPFSLVQFWFDVSKFFNLGDANNKHPLRLHIPVLFIVAKYFNIPFNILPRHLVRK